MAIAETVVESRFAWVGSPAKYHRKGPASMLHCATRRREHPDGRAFDQEDEGDWVEPMP